jgi:transcriptional regulator with XRE-family HTH domain
MRYLPYERNWIVWQILSSIHGYGRGTTPTNQQNSKQYGRIGLYPRLARIGKFDPLPDFYYSLTIFTMTTKQTVPNMLRFYRKQAGLRQVDVAAKLGFTSYDRISHWENGTAFPCVTNLFRLAALYKTTPQELYGEFCKMIQEKIYADGEGHSDSKSPFEYHLNDGVLPSKVKNTPNLYS